MVEPGKIRILTFGGLRAKNAKGEPVSYRTRKTGSLLAYLAVRLGKPQQRDAICAQLWPEAEESFARNSLSVALTHLRKQLKTDGQAPTITGDHNSVTLGYEGVDCDAVEFERLLKKGRLLEDPQEKLGAVFEALELYEGPFLVNDDEEWARLERFRLEQTFTRALGFALDSAKSKEDMDRAVNLAGKALGWNPKQPDLLKRMNLVRHRLGFEEEGTFRKGRAASANYQPEPANLIGEVHRMLEGGLEDVSSSAGENYGGAVPLSSPYYVARETDATFFDCIKRQESIVLLKGPRQIGKSSLLARGAAKARDLGATVMLTDFQSMDSDCLESTKALYLWLVSIFLDQLGSSDQAEAIWQDHLNPALNLERFVRDRVLGPERTVFWGLDEVDRVFLSSFRSDFFGLLRSWHNRRAMDPEGPWSRLTMAITYATEAHFFITDLNQSPFNVGTPLELADFDLRQVADLNQRYGNPIKNVADLQDLGVFLGGHPYLLRIAFRELAAGGYTCTTLQETALSEESPLADSLRRLSVLMDQNPASTSELHNLLRKQPLSSRDTFYRLKSAGFIRGTSQANAEIRCGLYKRFLKEKLG